MESDENTEDYEKRKREKAMEMKKTSTQIQNGAARKLLMSILGGPPLQTQITRHQITAPIKTVSNANQVVTDPNSLNSME
jgi:hypothetical protein